MTLKVFQAIHTRDELRRLYFRMIGDRQGDERGNSIKARINRTPEERATIKTAVRGTPKTIDGNPIKVRISNEFTFYLRLTPSWRRRDGRGALSRGAASPHDQSTVFSTKRCFWVHLP
jgi:hypothetical protein